MVLVHLQGRSHCATWRFYHRFIECEKVADSFRNNDINEGFCPSVFCLVTEATSFFLSGDPQTDHCLPKQWGIGKLPSRNMALPT